MLSRGPAKKVTIYLNEDSRHRLGSLHQAVMSFLLKKGVAGATATKALEGFGVHRQLHTPRAEVLAEHLPVKIEFIESAERVEELLPSLYDLVNDGLIEVQDTTVIKAAPKERKPEYDLPHRKIRLPAKLMRIFLGESDRLDGQPLYDAIVKKLRMLEIAGATVSRGIDGYGAKGHSHKRSFWHLSSDLPVMISVVDTAAKIEEATQAIAGMLGDGLIVLSDVEMIRFERSTPPATEVSGEGTTAR
jgi:PII-like signaling protein